MTNGQVSITEKGPAHSSAMGLTGVGVFSPYVVFCELGKSGDLMRPIALICCELHCCVSKQVLFSLSVNIRIFLKYYIICVISDLQQQPKKKDL